MPKRCLNVLDDVHFAKQANGLQLTIGDFLRIIGEWLCESRNLDGGSRAASFSANECRKPSYAS